jgi:uncharacterized protein YuzE
MRMKYDGEGDTLNILVKDGQIHHASEQDQLIINYDENGEVVEIEILRASRFLGEFLTGVIQAKRKARFIEIG